MSKKSNKTLCTRIFISRTSNIISIGVFYQVKNEHMDPLRLTKLSINAGAYLTCKSQQLIKGIRRSGFLGKHVEKYPYDIRTDTVENILQFSSITTIEYKVAFEDIYSYVEKYLQDIKEPNAIIL